MNGAEKFPSVIADIMNRLVTTVDVSMKVIDVAKIMAREKVGCVVVVERGKAVGIVTERDMLERILAAGRDPSKTTIGEIMSSPLIQVGEDSSILEAIRKMRRHNIRRLAVMEGEKLVGIVTDKDILRAVAILALASFHPLLEI